MRQSLEVIMECGSRSLDTLLGAWVRGYHPPFPPPSFSSSLSPIAPSIPPSSHSFLPTLEHILFGCVYVGGCQKSHVRLPSYTQTHAHTHTCTKGVPLVDASTLKTQQEDTGDEATVPCYSLTTIYSVYFVWPPCVLTCIHMRVLII